MDNIVLSSLIQSLLVICLMLQARSRLDKPGDAFPIRQMSNAAGVRGSIFVGNEIHKPLQRANDAAQTHTVRVRNARTFVKDLRGRAHAKNAFSSHHVLTSHR